MVKFIPVSHFFKEKSSQSHDFLNFFDSKKGSKRPLILGVTQLLRKLFVQSNRGMNFILPEKLFDFYLVLNFYRKKFCEKFDENSADFNEEV